LNIAKRHRLAYELKAVIPLARESPTDFDAAAAMVCTEAGTLPVTALIKLSEAVFCEFKLSSVVLVWPAALMRSFFEIRSLMTVDVREVNLVDADWTARASVRETGPEAPTLAVPSSRASLTALDLSMTSFVAVAAAPVVRPLMEVSRAVRAVSTAVKAAWMVGKSLAAPTESTTPWIGEAIAALKRAKARTCLNCILIETVGTEDRP